MGVLTFLPSTSRTIYLSEMLTSSPLRDSPLRVLSSAADAAGATKAKTSRARRTDIDRNLTKGNHSLARSARDFPGWGTVSPGWGWLGHGLLTVPPAVTAGLPPQEEETFGQPPGHGQETVPQRGATKSV